MSRIIKFRVWNKRENSWANINQLTDWESAEMTACVNFGNKQYPYQQMIIESDATYEIMLYTGIEDANGKEIYEGDLLRVTRDLEIYTKNPCKPYIYPVIYQTGVFDENNGLGDLWRVGFRLDDGEAWTDIDCYMEVVGNIYENPEMLKQPVERTE